MSQAFATLGLPETATPEEVKARWRELAKRWHPDRPEGSAVEFNTFRRAYTEAYALASEPKPCPTCSGGGKVTQSRGFNSVQLTCPDCGGSGNQ